MTTRRWMRAMRRPRSRRIQAFLAGGLVLGAGSAATLAAWNDAEYADATFTAGRFDIVGASDGVTFTSHATAPDAASLSFQLPPTAMAPGTTSYALYSVKTAGSSVAGELLVSAGVPGGTGLADHLTYGLRTVAGTTCDAVSYAAAAAAVVVAEGSPLTSGAAAADAQEVAANGASQVNYCFAVTLPPGAPNSAQGLTMTQTWQILGTSG